jgi:hypothetical protein
MTSLVGYAIAALVVYQIYSTYADLRRNIAAAKRSELPYIVARECLPGSL